MKIVKAYTYNELSPTARIDVDSAAHYYAAQMLLQNPQKPPPHLVPGLFKQFLEEFTKDGHFDITGQVYIPSKILKDPKEVSEPASESDSNVAKFPGAPASG